MFSRPFRKHGVASLATYVPIYKKGDTADSKGMGTVQKGMPHNCYQGKKGGVYSATQHAVGTLVNKQVKGKILAERINVCVEHIKPYRRCLQKFFTEIPSLLTFAFIHFPSMYLLEKNCLKKEKSLFFSM